VTAIVVAHLLVNIAHGLAHRELRVGLDPPASIFVTVVVLVSPLLAMALVWTTNGGCPKYIVQRGCSSHLRQR
jgi:membrane-associated PAP2 superfamily phosphatase